MKDLTFDELKYQIKAITAKENQITHWGLSDETETTVIKELQEQKKDLLALLHKKVDEVNIWID